MLIFQKQNKLAKSGSREALLFIRNTIFSIIIIFAF